MPPRIAESMLLLGSEVLSSTCKMGQVPTSTFLLHLAATLQTEVSTSPCPAHLGLSGTRTGRFLQLWQLGPSCPPRPRTRGDHPGSRVDSLCAHCCVGHAESSPVTVTPQARANRPMASTHLKLLRAPGLGKWAAACATDSAVFLLSPQKGLLANTGLLAPGPTWQPLAQLPPKMRPNCLMERSYCQE